ncbi:TetR/AcrR family transcriptional regulator [Pseudomonas putida]
MHASSLSSVIVTDARDRLLDAASSLFAAHGYQAIGLRDLATHLGLRPGSLYHHIDSKQALLFELIESSLTDLIYETRISLKRPCPKSERLQRFVQAFVSFNQEHPDKLTLLTRELVNLNDEQTHQIEVLKASYTNLLSEIVAAECGLHGPASVIHARAIAQAVLSLLCGQKQWGAMTPHWEQIVAFVQGIVCTGKSEIGHA